MFLDFYYKAKRWGRYFSFHPHIAFYLGFLSVIFGILTYVSLSTGFFGKQYSKWIYLFVNIDVLLLLSLTFVVGMRAIRLWQQRKKGTAGSKFHLRLVLTFGFMAIIPATLVSVFSIFFFNFGLQGWFNERIKTILDQSAAISEVYFNEHEQSLHRHAMQIAYEIRNRFDSFQPNSEELNEWMSYQTSIRDLSDAIIFDKNQGTLGRSYLSYSMDFETIPSSIIENTQRGSIVTLADNNLNSLRALIKIHPDYDLYLYIGQYANPSTIAAYMEKAHIAQTEYYEMEARRYRFQMYFALIYGLVMLLLLLSSMSVGLSLASRLAKPIEKLIFASNKIRYGDFSVRVHLDDARGLEFIQLARSFNRMASRLEKQTKELIDINQKLDLRREFIELVLEGVSAGVISLNENYEIEIFNKSASTILKVDIDNFTGQSIIKIFPGIDEYLYKSNSKSPMVQGQIHLYEGKESITLNVRITSEFYQGELSGYIITFDDITELEAAQRTAAWSGVARQVAHEIKNPLTPIRLSAERLKNKYINFISEEKGNFTSCVDTIIRHVDDIRRIVDEFSSFARMPTPVFHHEDLNDIITKAVILHQNAFPFIEFETKLLQERVDFYCDAQLIGQTLTNIIKNSIDSLQQNRHNTNQNGKVCIELHRDKDQITLMIDDNGPGFPDKHKKKLFTPYFTTKESGTGLGLSIVKKIIEDHSGSVELLESPIGGARVKVVFDLQRIMRT